jgi:3-hydroxy-5-methyl-1-naphthoate 3-O-methyltransferase
LNKSRQTSNKGIEFMAQPATGAVTPQHLLEMSWGFAPTLMLDAGVKIGLYEALDGKSMNPAQIAQKTGASPRGLKGLLEGLTGLGVLKRSGDQFSLAPDTAAFLVRGKPGYIGGVLKHFTGQLLDNWRNLAGCVKTGKPSTSVNEQAGGAEFFAQFVEDLYDLNSPGAGALAAELAKRFSLESAGKIRALDIAAGSGVWGIALAQRLPGVQLTAVDWPQVTPVTRKVAARCGVGDRLTTVEGDIGEVAFPTGNRVALLGHILHSEGEARSRKLLKKVYDALAPGGIIAIAEFVLDDTRTGPPFPLIFALNMLVHTQDGDAFTFGQLTNWLTDAGFTQVTQIPIPAPSPALVAVKPA